MTLEGGPPPPLGPEPGSLAALGMGVLVIALWPMSARCAERKLSWPAQTRPGAAGRFRDQEGNTAATG